MYPAMFGIPNTKIRSILSKLSREELGILVSYIGAYPLTETGRLRFKPQLITMLIGQLQK